MDSRSLERKVLLALLSNTQKAPVIFGKLREELGVAEGLLSTYLRQLRAEGLLSDIEESIRCSPAQRLRIAIKVTSLGGDTERIARNLGWSEFENFVSYAFEENGYNVSRHFRYKSSGRRWEIDVLATRAPFFIIAECKHWQKGLGISGAERTVNEHLARTKALAEVLQSLRHRIRFEGWTKAVLVPVLVSLIENRHRFYSDVPVVPVLQLPSFLTDLPSYYPGLAHTQVRLDEM